MCSSDLNVGAPETLMTTLPDPCPVAAGVVPVAGGVVVPLAPTVAVTVAVTTVRRLVTALPFPSVLTVEAPRDPAVVVKDTRAFGSGLPLTS